MPDLLDPAPLDLASDPELGPLLAAHPDIKTLRYRDGERLVVEGEESQDLYIVRKGSLVVEKALPDGTLRPLAQLECSTDAPVIVGEMAYFGAQRRTATVRAVGSCQVLHLQPRHLDAIMAGFPGLTRILCRQFTSRLKEANEELRDLRARFDLAALPHVAQPGEVLVIPGEPADQLYQLTMGAVRIGEGERSQVLRADQLPGGFLALEPFLRGGVHRSKVTVEETSFLAVIPTHHREAFLRSHPALVLKLLQEPT